VSTRLTVFVSSTVRDFGPVRRDIVRWLRGRRIEVLESEGIEFPVDPALHSHDVCLRAIEGSHVFLLLIGWRYGGLYRHGPKSITWCEWDVARELKIPTITLVLKEVNDEAARATQARRALAPSLSSLDPAVARFIDEVRKAPYDNWVHLDWDGSYGYVKRCLQARIDNLFVSYQKPHQKLERRAVRLEPYVKARSLLDQIASVGRGRKEALAELLKTAVDYREPLFDFRDRDRYNLVVYRREGDVLRVAARQAHPDIEVHNRPWQVGDGHIGLTAQLGKIMVAPDLQQTGEWRGQYPSDEKNYISTVCVPIGHAGVLVITSNRRDHFRDLRQEEVLTAASLANMIQLMAVLA
jgi:uncharacterized protein DUF4062